MVKVSPKKVLVTLLLISVTMYQVISMIYFYDYDKQIRSFSYLMGTFVMCLALLTIAVFNLNRRIKLPFGLAVVSFMLFFFPMLSAMWNSQQIYHTLLSQNLTWILLFVAFYCATFYYDELPVKKFWVFLSYAILLIVSIPLIQIQLSGNGDRGSVIFLTYNCLTILPLVLYCSSHKSRYIPIIISLIVILVTTKRAGIIVAVLGFILFYLKDFKSKKNQKQKIFRVIKVIILGVIIISSAVIVLKQFNIDIIARFDEVSNDGGSGRNYIWFTIYQNFVASDFMHKLFGHGIDSVFSTVQIYSDVRIKAHNDFLEMLYDYGVVGLFTLIVFIIYLTKEWLEQSKNHTEQMSIYSYSMVIMIVFSMLSYFFIESLIIDYVAIYWGIIFAKRFRNNSK